MLTQTHSMTVRATAYGPYGTQELPISGGAVTSDATSQVRRTASLDTPYSMWPADPTKILAPFGTEVQVDYGIVLPGGGIEWVPLIRGLISETSRSVPVDSNGSLSVQLVDRSARVAENRYTAPVQSVAGATAVNEIKRLLQETLGVGLAVVDTTGSTQVASQLDIERERWADGIEKLADSIAAEVFFDPQGNAVIRPQPLITDAPVWVDPTTGGGVLIGQSDKLNREQVYNGVTASGQRSDGTAPAIATVWDTDPNSATYYLGPFGQKPKLYVSPLLTTTLQCQTTAAAILARSKGMQAQVTFTAVVNPALEAGDVIVIGADAGQAHIIDKVTVPLSPTDSQSIETRSADPVD